MAEITRELREYATGLRIDLDAIADRIDAEHKSALASAYGEGAESVGLPDLTGYVKLPVDADGVPIRVGDVMECGDGTVFTVENISLHPFGWRCSGDGIDGNGYECTVHQMADCCRHHLAPTVEGVLQEILFKAHIYDEREMELLPDLIAEYASRLRLAGDV